jgi:hypothetical protein
MTTARPVLASVGISRAFLWGPASASRCLGEYLGSPTVCSINWAFPTIKEVVASPRIAPSAVLCAQKRGIVCTPTPRVPSRGPTPKGRP